MKQTSIPDEMIRTALLTHEALHKMSHSDLFGCGPFDLLDYDGLITIRVNYGVCGGVLDMDEDELQILFEPIRRDFLWWKLWLWFGYWRMKRKREKRRERIEPLLREQLMEAIDSVRGSWRGEDDDAFIIPL